MIRLDAEQSAAANIGRRPVRVVAGAGTGKTAVIAERFRRLVKSGASPSSILVMTFTDRAAAEMRERIEDLTGVTAPAVGTFHAIALSWLRADGRAIGVPAGFRIITGADRWILARELMWRLGDLALTGDERPDDLVSPALQMLERLKQELVPLERLAAWSKTAEDRPKAELMQACVRLFRAYERECRKQRLLDFEDLLALAVRMLEKNAALLDAYRARYPHVLVDEYQDLNLAQERLVELVAGGGHPFVVGDDDQSIYRFRGASRASLERFVEAFPTATTVTLGRNHRSSRRIVAAASVLVGNNADRLAKALRSSRAGERVQICSCADGVTEADAIAAEAARLMTSGVAAADIAVLCRTNAIARPIAGALAAKGLPHVVIGGHGFHDRSEIKDMIALLRVLRDPCDVVALARALTRPPASLDQDQALTVLRERMELPPLEALQGWAPASGFARLLQTLSAQAAVLDVRDLFFELMEKTRYLEVLSSQLETSEAARSVANVSRFADLIAEFCEMDPDHSLEAYLRHLELVLLSQEDERPAEVEGLSDAIHVMTIHQAKGLEFDAVFVPGLVEGRLPQSGRSPRFELPAAVLEPLVRGREDVIAEERRLLYVAMTRAQRFLYLTRASHYEGGRRWRDSRFIEEVRAAGGRTIVLRDIAGDRVSPPPALPAGGEGDPATARPEAAGGPVRRGGAGRDHARDTAAGRRGPACRREFDRASAAVNSPRGVERDHIPRSPSCRDLRAQRRGAAGGISPGGWAGSSARVSRAPVLGLHRWLDAERRHRPNRSHSRRLADHRLQVGPAARPQPARPTGGAVCAGRGIGVEAGSHPAGRHLPRRGRIGERRSHAPAADRRGKARHRGGRGGEVGSL